MKAWSLPALAPLVHGSMSGAGHARFDFSGTANTAGPLPSVAAAVAAADRTRYPDASYQALCDHLAHWHGSIPERIVIAGSASEFIHRFTHLATRSRRVLRALVPRPGCGEYAAAAQVAGLEVLTHGAQRPRAPTADDLWWVTEPSNPTGSTLGGALDMLVERAQAAGALVALDLAYHPLRLDNRPMPPGAQHAWHLWSPNKSCGLPGVRSAYAIAPPGSEAVAKVLRASAPSWIAGAEGVALLQAFAGATAQDELADQRRLLRAWREMLSNVLRGAGWKVHDTASVTPFFVAQPPAGVAAAMLNAQGIRVCETSSMGLPGRMRLSAQAPEAIAALLRALEAR